MLSDVLHLGLEPDLVRPRRVRASVIVVAAVALVTPGSAHAYIDPGTGSYIVQAVVAAIAGGLVAIKMYWQRVKGFLTGGGGGGNSGDSGDGTPEAND